MLYRESNERFSNINGCENINFTNLRNKWIPEIMGFKNIENN